MMKKNFIIVLVLGEHGNIFDFVMKTQNLKFGEAVKMLANLAGMQPYTFSKQDEERERNWNIYKSIYSKYVEFYHNEIFKNPSATKAKEYIKKEVLLQMKLKILKLVM